MASSTTRRATVRTVRTVRGPVRLTLGRLNPAARSAFKSGQCAALALALNAATDLPLVAIADAIYPGRYAAEPDPATGVAPWVHPGSLGPAFVHAAVRLPSGDLLDVDGVRDARTVLAEWDHGFATDPQPFEDGDEGWRTCRPGCLCTEWCYPSGYARLYEVTRDDLYQLPAYGGGPELRVDVAATFVEPLLAECGLTRAMPAAVPA